MKNIRIATLGTPHDYRSSLLPIVITTLGYKIDWVPSSKADLLILGPFIPAPKKPYQWCPKPLRPITSSVNDSLKKLLITRKYEPLKIFHTQENVRYDQIKADYSISFDLGVETNRHFRLPYWMEMLDWSHEGIAGNTNPRYGELLKISTLMSPLGNRFLTRGGSCAILSSHLRQPRESLYRAIDKAILIQGFGAYFDSAIKNHHASRFLKKDILEKFSFNLCPENGLYPGYYTEKIPEAFHSGCLPITWVDQNIGIDFNPNAIINMLNLAEEGYESIASILLNPKVLEQYKDEALVMNKPSTEQLSNFISTCLGNL